MIVHHERTVVSTTMYRYIAQAAPRWYDGRFHMYRYRKTEKQTVQNVSAVSKHPRKVMSDSFIDVLSAVTCMVRPLRLQN
jgi:hypothetical protein